MFDGPTSRNLDLTAAVVSLNLRAVHESDALCILMTCAASWLERAVEARRRPKPHLARAGTPAWRNSALPSTEKSRQIPTSRRSGGRPSGLEVTRDIRERLKLFLLHDWIRHEDERRTFTSKAERRECLIREHGHRGWDARLDVRRLALTWNEVQPYSPPPNPAKSTDARRKCRAGWRAWSCSAPQLRRWRHGGRPDV